CRPAHRALLSFPTRRSSDLTAPRDAVITAASHPDDLGASFGVHRTLDNIGAAIGPLLAFFILLLIPDGYGIVFVASLGFAVIGVTILGLFVPNVRTRPDDTTGSEAEIGRAHV